MCRHPSIDWIGRLWRGSSTNADPDGREPRMIGGEWHDHGINLTGLATEKRRLQSVAANWEQTPEARDWASNRAEWRRLAQQGQQGAQERADYQDRQDFRWWNPTTWHVQDGDLLRHHVLHRVSWVTNGVATVADGIAVGCAFLAIPSVGFTLGCTTVAGGVGAVAGTASATLDLADMGTGGKEWNPVDAGGDLLSLGTIPFARMAANANRTARYLSRAGQLNDRQRRQQGIDLVTGSMGLGANSASTIGEPVDSFWGVGGLGDIFLGGWDQ